jgi:hypothetical protein
MLRNLSARLPKSSVRLERSNCCHRHQQIVGASAVLCLSALPCCASAQSQNGNERCYTVEETSYNIHEHRATRDIKPITHCYSDKDHPYRYSILDCVARGGQRPNA